MAQQQATLSPPSPLESQPEAAGPAYFLDVTLTNVRCFGPEPQTLRLSDPNGNPARWTVLIGNNGTGKTTILQALASFESVPFGPAPQFKVPWLLHPSSSAMVRAGAAAALLEATTTSRTSLTGLPAVVETHRSKLSQGSNGVKTGAVSKPLPVCYGYGASRRLGRDASIHGPSGAANGTAGLFSDDSELLDAEEWLLRIDYSASKPSPIQQRQVERRAQVIELLKRILPEVDEIRFTQPVEERPTPTVEFLTPYGWVPLRGLGHGYRTLIAWMVDFAGRMVERYQESPNPLAESAVVLVDEIDLHLHPAWQRKLVGHLTGLFPNTQFIATAHSPLIVQAAGAANVAVLRREGDHVVIDNNVETIRGWRIDQILTSDLFNLPTARPPEFDDKLARRVQLLSKPTLSDDDKREVAQLEAEIGVLPSGETADEAKRILKVIEESHELIRKYGA